MRRSVVLSCVVGVSSSACGNALYSMRILRASNEVVRAEQLDAATEAPYEYFYAVEHLRKARSEAAAADFSDAAALAEIAYRYAGQAIQRAQRVDPVSGPTQSLPE